MRQSFITFLRYHQIGLRPDLLPEDCGALTGKDGKTKEPEILLVSADRNREKRLGDCSELNQSPCPFLTITDVLSCRFQLFLMLKLRFGVSHFDIPFRFLQADASLVSDMFREFLMYDDLFLRPLRLNGAHFSLKLVNYVR